MFHVQLRLTQELLADRLPSADRQNDLRELGDELGGVTGMSRIVAIANQKGGVGKTTTAVNLSAAVAQRGRRVLLLDLDPQANATSGVGLPRGDRAATSYDLLVGERPLPELIRSSEVPGLDVIPAVPELAGAEVELVGEAGWERILSNRIRDLPTTYDYVFIDSPPSLGLLTVNALVAAHSVLIPLQCEYYALEGLSHLLDTIRLIRERLNASLEIEGILLTMYDGRLNLSIQVAEDARRYFGGKVYATMIPRNVRLGEAPGFGKPITVYDPTCIGAMSYFNLAEEVLGNGQKGSGEGAGRTDLPGVNAGSEQA